MYMCHSRPDEQIGRSQNFRESRSKIETTKQSKSKIRSRSGTESSRSVRLAVLLLLFSRAPSPLPTLTLDLNFPLLFPRRAILEEPPKSGARRSGGHRLE